MLVLFRTLLLLFSFIGLVACSSLSTEDSTTVKPAELTSVKKETVKLQEVWSFNVGKGVNDRFEQLVPAMDGDKVFAASVDGHVVALDKKTGKKIWQQPLDKLQVSGAIDAGYGKVVLGTINGFVVALDQKSGKPLWKHKVSSEVLVTPKIAGNFIIVKTIDDVITVLSANDGKEIWNQKVLQPALTLRGSSAPVIDRDAVFTGYANGEAKAYRLKDGLQLWETRVSVPKGSTELERMVDIGGAPLIVGDMLYVSGYRGNVAALDIYNGKTRWSKPVSGFQSLAEGFGLLYVVDQQGVVRALDQKTGASGWQYDRLKGRQLTAPQTFSSVVAVGDYEGYLHLLSQVDGSLVGRFKVSSSAIKAQPVTDGDRFYILDTNGKLFALSKSDK
ncbi:Outer membrane protein assembly factor BamB [invertebrate metagenome]|uniref:Outer membrane protein assembly factor BamB n=1 Tax=invertebrate metagenome TaxID=1711999 RepID=A0A2H9T999_9ZZZZ